jgi:hypothetical protein
MMRSLGTLMLTALVLSPLTGRAQETKAKHTIKEVMQAAHGREGARLRQKVIDGQATAEEKVQLMDMYLSLAENAPPRGSAEDWHTKTDALLVAAVKVVAGREDGVAALRTASNCMACHSAHRPPQN